MPLPPPLLPLASTQLRPPVQARLQLPWELKEPPPAPQEREVRARLTRGCGLHWFVGICQTL